MENKSIRIHANIGEEKEKIVKININQDFKTIDFLSLKINQKDNYKLYQSNYGVVVGRILANRSIGIPNARISVFIQVSNEDINNAIKSGIYPYNTTNDKNNNNVRYNLLSDTKEFACHNVIGTFPNKRLILDDNNFLEIFDTYYKLTTTTNACGDYMICGVPTGNQTIHVDLDISDIGILSQKPRDLIYKGYNINQFENANQFKYSTDLDNLAQVMSQDKIVNVYPFWGDESEGEIAITRADIEFQYDFTPTCVFIGSVISDTTSNAIGKKCIATEKLGAMNEMVTGQGTIEMIRKKINGSVEEFRIQGNELINGSGVWCYQIPMNLDYITSDEYGNIVPTDDIEKGIPTRSRVRFRISLSDNGDEYGNTKRGKILVPHNPQNKNELDYDFGGSTKDSSFRDIMWNNVYSIKSYIPRIQKGNRQRNKKFTGIKHTNNSGSNNPMPYNNIRIQIPFMFSFMCIVYKFIIWITKAYNWIVNKVPTIFNIWSSRSCLSIPEGFCEEREGWYYAPGCSKTAKKGWGWNHCLNGIAEDNQQGVQGGWVDGKSIDSQSSEGSSDVICLTRYVTYLTQCMEISLAKEYNVISFDFYNDWINGCIYIPTWIRNIRKKRKYFFGLIRRNPKVEYCSTENTFSTRILQQCAPYYKYDNKTNEITVTGKYGCQSSGKNQKSERCHKPDGSAYVWSGGGLIKLKKNLKDASIYYYRPALWYNVINYGLIQEVKETLFATDLILLGNLNECNIYGIPQAFRYLEGTSYKMPSALALTNLDVDGYTYVANDSGTACYRRKNDALLQAINADLDEDGREDGQTYFTEMSGIDWGYTGPDQGSNSSYSNHNGELPYRPGGLFLGIACTNAQTNYKSCINLIRTCEIGTWLDSRQEFPKNLSELKSGNYTNSKIPNGLISRDELSDSDVRAMFATMNVNRLSTVKNKDTQYLEYDFRYLYPYNFEGSLSAKKDNNGNITNWSSAYTQRSKTLETYSSDYVLFRMGTRPSFYTGYGDSVRFPRYENSFYFYFGLKEGNTAIDEFNRQYLATCEKETLPDFEIYNEINEVSWDSANNNSFTIISSQSIGSSSIKPSISIREYNGTNKDYSFKDIIENATDGVDESKTDIYFILSERSIIVKNAPFGLYTVNCINQRYQKRNEQITLYPDVPSMIISQESSDSNTGTKNKIKVKLDSAPYNNISNESGMSISIVDKSEMENGKTYKAIDYPNKNNDYTVTFSELNYDDSEPKNIVAILINDETDDYQAFLYINGELAENTNADIQIEYHYGIINSFEPSNVHEGSIILTIKNGESKSNIDSAQVPSMYEEYQYFNGPIVTPQKYTLPNGEVVDILLDTTPAEKAYISDNHEYEIKITMKTPNNDGAYETYSSIDYMFKNNKYEETVFIPDSDSGAE